MEHPLFSEFFSRTGDSFDLRTTGNVEPQDVDGKKKSIIFAENKDYLLIARPNLGIVANNMLLLFGTVQHQADTGEKTRSHCLDLIKPLFDGKIRMCHANAKAAESKKVTFFVEEIFFSITFNIVRKAETNYRSIVPFNNLNDFIIKLLDTGLLEIK